MNGLIILSLPVSNPHFDSLVPFLVQRGSLLSDGWEQITVWYQTVLSIRISGVRIRIHYCNQNFFLTGEAAEWAKDNPLMQARITTQSPTNDGVQAIKQLMQDRFPQHFCEAHTFDINAKFGDLHQRLEETLLTHYKRASKLYDETCRCRRPENGDFSLASWDRFSRWYHQVICKEYNQLFIRKRGCQEIELTSKIILLGAFYWRGSRTNKGSKITKLADEEPRKKQLHYYKSLAEKNILSSCPRQSQASIGYSFSHLTTETQPKGQPVIAPRPNKPGNNK